MTNPSPALVLLTVLLSLSLSQSRSLSSSVANDTPARTPESRQLQSSALSVEAMLYECDGRNERIDPPPKKSINDRYVKFCIAPTAVTQNRDIFVRSVESLTLVRNIESTDNDENAGSVQQTVVENRVEVGEILSLAVCIPGSSVCTVQTQIHPSLFYGTQDATVTVTADVAMQFGTRNTLWMDGNDDDNRKQRHLHSQPHRRLQFVGGDGNYAGSSEAQFQFDVLRAKKPSRDSDSDDDGNNNKKHWWKDSPVWQRFLLILVSVVVFCVFCCCFAAFCFWMREEIISHKDRDNRNEKLQHQDDEHEDDQFDERSKYNDDDVSLLSASQAGNDRFAEEPYDHDDDISRTKYADTNPSSQYSRSTAPNQDSYSWNKPSEPYTNEQYEMDNESRSHTSYSSKRSQYSRNTRNSRQKYDDASEAESYTEHA